MSPLIIIPTRNHENQIDDVLAGIFHLELPAHILVVDCHSTDGTVEAVRAWEERHPQIKLLTHDRRLGFGEALRIGFKVALEGDYDPIITMDGDGSHDPHFLQNLIETSFEYDFVLGSRYIDGVRVEGWGFRRLLISKLANTYVAHLLIKPIWDFTCGFRCYRRAFLERINLDSLHIEGSLVLVQLLHLAYQNHARVKEIPFVYRDHGVPKIGPHSTFKTLLFALKYRAPLLEIIRHLALLKKEYKRFVAEYDELINLPQLKADLNNLPTSDFKISVGVMAYNEERIIGECLNGLQNQELSSGTLDQIIVVSSGSTDRTNEIVQEMAANDPRIKLVIQPRRMGKASAINEYLAVAEGDIAILESGDTVTVPQTIEALIQPFKDPDVGMVGAHPMPVNKRDSFVGFSVHKLWELHHYMALDSPKCGEMVAFRNLIPHIPNYTAVDEAMIEGIFKKQGMRLAYAGDAIVKNKGPENLADFIKQRRRIASGHRHLQVTIQHQVSTQSAGSIFSYVWAHQKWTPTEIIYMGLLMSLEAYSRFMGMVDFYLRDKNPYIWDISKTTKLM